MGETRADIHRNIHKHTHMHNITHTYTHSGEPRVVHAEDYEKMRFVSENQNTTTLVMMKHNPAGMTGQSGARYLSINK